MYRFFFVVFLVEIFWSRKKTILILSAVIVWHRNLVRDGVHSSVQLVSWMHCDLCYVVQKDAGPVPAPLETVLMGDVILWMNLPGRKKEDMREPYL